MQSIDQASVRSEHLLYNVRKTTQVRKVQQRWEVKVELVGLLGRAFSTLLGRGRRREIVADKVSLPSLVAIVSSCND